jgi:hypothetical protein
MMIMASEKDLSKLLKTVNINKKCELIKEYLTPKIIGELNGQYVKLAKIKDELIWYSHQDENEREEVWIMLIEPKETKHTGNIRHEKTVK